MAQLQLQIRSVDELPATRHEVRNELRERGFGTDDVWTLELVVAELLGAAYDSDVQSPMVVQIETFARLHSVRLRGSATSTCATPRFTYGSGCCAG
jgi:anti-sigma regulatory factor (Ser/Thr protein kinase)